jgi:hypothetical protein
MQVRELTGAALDWAVAKCEGEKYQANTEYDGIGTQYPPHRFSSDWSQGGPIIEREDIAIFPGVYVMPMFWCAVQDKGGSQPRRLHDLDNAAWWFEEPDVTTGPTPLIAAMRCYVASRFGKEIEVPNQVTSG